MKRIGRTIPRAETRFMIGPPLKAGFTKLLGDPDLALRCVALYREYFRDRGIFENRVYPGVMDMLEALGRAGVRSAVATSKPEEFSRKIIDHFSLDGYFEAVCGATMDETRTAKWEVIEYALERCGVADRSAVLMVGDREHDVVGAARCGIRTLGVLYGYGSREELTDAGAIAVAETVEAVGDYILNDDGGNVHA